MSTSALVLPFLKNLLQTQTPQPDIGMPNQAPPAPQLPPSPQMQAVAPPQQQPSGDPSLNTISALNSQAPDAMGQAQAQPQFQETKGHKLLRILQGGLVGGLNGLAADAQTYAQTGRNAGFGGGFQGAIQMPFIQALQRGQLGQQQAQTEILRQQAQEINVPGYGNMPAGLAKVLFPSLIRGQATTEAAQTRARATTQAAQIGAESRQRVAQINQGAPIPMDETVANLIGMPEMANMPVGKGTIDNVNKMLEAKGYKTQDLGAEGMWLLDKAGNRIKRIGDSARMDAATARPVQVADDANPGNTKYVTGAQAISSGAAGPQSASVQAPKAVAKAEVIPDAGKQKLAFNTAMQHADLLTAAVNALGNGDNQTLNSLKNRFATEFGSSGPITSQAIADAYTREVTSMLAKGHMTDAEVGSVGSTLNVNKQSPQQSLGVLAAYKALAGSKMQQLNQQQQNAVSQSQKKKPNNKDPLSIR